MSFFLYSVLQTYWNILQRGFEIKKMKLHLMRCLEWQNTSVMRYEASLRGNCVVMVMSWLAQLTLFLLPGVSRRTTAGTQMDLRHPGASRLSQRCGRHCVCKLNAVLTTLRLKVQYSSTESLLLFQCCLVSALRQLRTSHGCNVPFFVCGSWRSSLCVKCSSF